MAFCAAGAVDAATFSIVNKDAAGSGLNDTTAFTPVGGNTATTLGQARLNVITEAARIWGNQLSSSQSIVIDAQFAAQTCTATSGTLASAGPLTYFTGGSLPLANVLYPAALADALTATNVNGRDDINMTINSSVGTGASCLNGRSFYLGLDHVNGSNIDLLNTLLHEIAHGLGFVSLTDQTGASLASNGRLSVFDQFIYYEASGKFWPGMTNAERATASVSNGALVWNGAAVNAQLSRMTAGLSNPGGHLRLYAPTTWDDGSSVSHWDSVAKPDLLMEPFLRPNPLGLTDLTGCVLRDIGWSGTRCPDVQGANSPPVALSQSVATNEDTPVQITLRGTDSDGSGLLTYSVVNAPSKGTLSTTASLTSATGVVYTYTPFADVNGTDSFTFQVNDGTDASAVATVNISIAAVNDAPVAIAETVTTTSGVAVSVPLSAIDVDGDALTYTVASSPTSGTLSGTAPNLTYTSSTGFVGTDTFSFRASDGQLSSAPAVVTLIVTAPQANSSGGSGSSSGSSNSGGGGAIDWTELALLASLAVIRLRRAGFGARRSVRLNS